MSTVLHFRYVKMCRTSDIASTSKLSLSLAFRADQHLPC
jgi:hypothetical protein